MTKETVRISDYAGVINEELPKGILMNTMGDKFNSMVIGWGHLGILWGIPTFAAYVRQSRYTKELVDASGGMRSGRDIDKAEAAGLTLAEPEVIKTPGILEYPLTLECRVLYAQDQEVPKIPEEITAKYYPEENGKVDYHTMYVAKIVAAYLIRE